jgi:hypothetical protein
MCKERHILAESNQPILVCLAFGEANSLKWADRATALWGYLITSLLVFALELISKKMFVTTQAFKSPIYWKCHNYTFSIYIRGCYTRTKKSVSRLGFASNSEISYIKWVSHCLNCLTHWCITSKKADRLRQKELKETKEHPKSREHPPPASLDRTSSSTYVPSASVRKSSGIHWHLPHRLSFVQELRHPREQVQNRRLCPKFLLLAKTPSFPEKGAHKRL